MIEKLIARAGMGLQAALSAGLSLKEAEAEVHTTLVKSLVEDDSYKADEASGLVHLAIVAAKIW